MLSLRRSFTRTWANAAALLRRADGIAAVEFSLILPLLLVLYFGSTAVTQAVRASRKIDLVSAALANLASQQLTCSTSGSSGPCLTDDDMTGSNGIFTAASAIMAPFDTTNLQMTVSQVTISEYPANSGTLIANVNWTVTNSGGTARPCNGGGVNGSLQAGNVASGSANYQYYMPTSYTASGAPKGSMIVADVAFQYKPGFGFDFYKWGDTTTSFSMYNIGYYRNRNSSGGAAGPITASMTAGKTACP